MELSTKPRDGLRTLAQIAGEGGDDCPVSGKEVAQKQGISIAYIEQILIPMRNDRLNRKRIRFQTVGIHARIPSNHWKKFPI